jgi:hypothetical protein
MGRRQIKTLDESARKVSCEILWWIDEKCDSLYRQTDLRGIAQYDSLSYTTALLFCQTHSEVWDRAVVLDSILKLKKVQKLYTIPFSILDSTVGMTSSRRCTEPTESLEEGFLGTI